MGLKHSEWYTSHGHGHKGTPCKREISKPRLHGECGKRLELPPPHRKQQTLVQFLNTTDGKELGSWQMDGANTGNSQNITVN